MATQIPPEHRWFTPADCAALLSGVKHGDQWRAPCPVHGGESTDALSIRQVIDRYGNPKTSLHCFAHDCAIEDICAEMGIEVRQLYSIQPEYARATKHVPRAKSPRIERLKRMEDPTPDEIAQILLEEMIVSDPPFIQECAPARQKMWDLAEASPKAKARLTQALRQTGLIPSAFWAELAWQMGEACDGDHA
jgi:hypothetical protein